MKKIKVYLQYPWKFPDSPYYKYLIQTPPEKIEYLNVEKQKGVITSKKVFWFSNFLKRNIRRATNLLNLSIPNAHLSPAGDYDLIHCAHCLSKNENKPWVADIETLWSMWVSGMNTSSGKEKVKKILLNKNCKKIMPWTEATKKEITRIFPEVFEKLEVVYPAVRVKIRARKKNKKITLIFSGRYFYSKGGLHALEAMDILTKKYSEVYAIFNSEVPKEVINKYSKNKKISFCGLIPQKKLFELYNQADILLYPGYTDSFGFAYLEAMSFGIPIITVDGFARKEIVEEGKTGFVIEKTPLINPKQPNEEIVSSIIEKASILIENRKILEEMSKKCVEEIKNGKFSIKERNKKMKRIYGDAIK